MRLTLTERVIIANQLRILEALYPDERNDLSKKRTAIESGFTKNYADLAGMFSKELSEADCESVWKVLDMHRALHDGFAALPNPSGIDERDIKFGGFDGNNESRHRSYARYILGDLEMYEELHEPGHGYDTHMPTIAMYDRMLGAWEQSADKAKLTAQYIQRICAARAHP